MAERGLNQGSESALFHMVPSDREITSIEQDELGRADFARKVVERIGYAGSGPSVVFGLSAPWGTGKTSTLNMITSLLSANDHPSSTWAVATFTPWSCSDADELVNEFYLAVAAVMPATLEGEAAKSLLKRTAPFAMAIGKAALSAVVDKYVGDDFVNKIASAGAESLAEEVATIASRQQSFVERFDSIAAAIRESGSNILVVIDDVDRLHADELLTVMKVVRLLGRFDRVHYLLCYDEATLIDVLTSTDIARGRRDRAHQYLEKIVQLPFALPPIQLRQLESAITAHLTTIAEIHYRNQPDGEILHLTSLISQIIRNIPNLRDLTLRGVRRWCGQIDILMALTGAKEIDLHDAALITFVRVFYADIYRRLPAWKSELVGGHEVLAIPGQKREAVSEILQRRIKATLDNGGNPPEATDEVLGLLRILFPRVGGDATRPTNRLAISNSEYFDRYVSLGIPIDDIRDMEVRADLEHLVVEGAFERGSVIRTALTNRKFVYQVLDKAYANIDVVSNASSGSAIASAIELVRISDVHDRIFTPLAAVLFQIVGRAVSAVVAPEDAVAVIDRFENAVGLFAAADVLSPRASGDVELELAIREASVNLRKKVLCVAEVDLFSESDVEDMSILALVRYLDDELWELLRGTATRGLDDGRWNLADLAGRFTTFGKDSGGEMSRPRFYAEYFELLIPRDLWATYDLPGNAEDPVYVGDSNLESRIAWAAHILHQELPKRDGM